MAGDTDGVSDVFVATFPLPLHFGSAEGGVFKPNSLTALALLAPVRASASA